MLECVVRDRSHALRNCLILEVDAVDPAVDCVAALGSAIHPPVIARVRREPPTAEPVRRVRQKLVAASGAADRPAVLEGRLRLRQRRYAALPPQEADNGGGVVQGPPGTRMHVTAELAVGCQSPKGKCKAGEAPIGAIRAGRAVGSVLRAPSGIGDMVLRGAV